ncbi:MAG: GGDEF domain-containing protein [Methylococcales bacterium]|nr:GGDEF domain-containing protein [Methylococcales bacterium]
MRKTGLGLWIILLLLATLANVQARALHDGWYYRYGDSPVDANGRMTWALPPFQAQDWQSTGFPSNPPGRGEHHFLWLAKPLPAVPWPDPVLYVFSIDLIAEMYLDGRKIYQHGDLSPAGRRFVGWPWHQIDLPADYAGKVLYVRVYSDYPDIGLWGEVLLLDHAGLIEHIFAQSFLPMFSALLTGFIGLLAVLFGLLKGGRLNDFHVIALFAFAASLIVFEQSLAKQWLWHAPLAWNELGAFAYFVLPIPMLELFRRWCAKGSPMLLHALLAVHGLFIVCAAVIMLFGKLAIHQLYFVFDGLFLLTMLVLLISMFTMARVRTVEHAVVMLAYGTFTLFMVYDALVAHSLVPWLKVPMAWPLLLFALAMISLSLRHFHQAQQRLAYLNQSLEQEVRQRTEELEKLVLYDPMTQIFNRRAFYQYAEPMFNSAERYQRHLALLVLDIDFFKRFNDTYGHATGDQVIIHVAQCCQTMARSCDVVARFGGEEFVILLEQAGKEQALALAERVRSTLADMHIERLAETITISCGVAIWDGKEDIDALLARADRALYRAKETGRNRVIMDTN